MGKRGLKIVIGLLLLAILGVAGYIGEGFYREKVGSKSSSQVSQGQDKKQEPAQFIEEEGQVEEKKPEQTGPVKTVLYLDKTANKVIAINPTNKAESDYWTTPNDNRIYSARLSSTKSQWAVVTSLDSVTRVEVSPLNQLDFQTVDQAEPKTLEQKVNEVSLRRIQFFSPNDRYLTYSYTGWEFCGDKYYSLNSQAIVDVDSQWCGATRWSKTGKRLARFTSAGIATGNEFALSPYGSIDPFAVVDWSKTTGDITIDTNFNDFASADFIDDNTVVIASRYDNYNGDKSDQKPIKIFAYDDKAKTTKLLASYAFPDTSEYIVDIRVADAKTIYLLTTRRLYKVNQNSKTLEPITLEGSEIGENDTFESYGLTDGYLVVAKERYSEPEKATNRENKLYLVDASNDRVTKFDLNGGSFVGILNK